MEIYLIHAYVYNKGSLGKSIGLVPGYYTDKEAAQADMKRLTEKNYGKLHYQLETHKPV